MNIKSYVISLERAKDRRARAEAEQQRLGLPHVFIAAVDGRAPDADFASEGYREDLGRRLRNIHQRRGLSLCEQACALSHLKAYERIVADGVDVGLVSEDDAAFRCSGSSLIEALGALPDGWDIFYLYHRGDIRPAGPNLVSFSSFPGNAVSYAVTRDAAARLLELARPLRLAADALIGRAVLIGLLRGYGAFPLLADHRDQGKSFLSEGRDSGAIRALKEALLANSMSFRRLSFLFPKPNSCYCRFW